MAKKWYGLLAVFLLPMVYSNTWAQSNNDQLIVLPLEEVWNRVIEHHPIAQQAGLLPRQAEAALLAARGSFDPKAFADWEQKSFKGSEYYTFSESGLKIPTWYGLELKGVYQTAGGINVSPESTLPGAGQAVIGVKASALRGLVIDERRATLQQAKLLKARNTAERQAILNDLLLETAEVYWEWWAAYQQWQVFQRALENAQERQVAIVSSFLQGDKPAIDTIESLVQVQNRTLELQEASLNFQNAGLQLANFLWQDGNIPLELNEDTVPEDFSGPESRLALDLPLLLQDLDNQHPDLRLSQLKISDLEISRRLAAEQLKPRLDLEYNFLGTGFDFVYQKGADAGIRNLITENYKLGISFEMPLFLRKERGKLQQTELKILDADYQLRQKRLSINNKIMGYYNQWQTTQQQLALFNQTVANYQRLLDAELRKFNIGESSIFLINSRENKLIEAELKLIKLQATLPKLESAVQWAAGRLMN